jgi:hypothetical protein
MAGRDVTPIQTQFERVTDARDLLDQMLADCSTATELIDASTSAAELLDRMKIVSSSIDGKLRALAASGPVSPRPGRYAWVKNRSARCAHRARCSCGGVSLI